MNNEEVHGYKAFNKDRTNRYGIVFEEGNTYKDIGDISFGNSSVAGFHMCKNLEDTFRYFPAMEEEISVAAVTGMGKMVKYDDEYYGYYDMYAVEQIKIDHFLTRKEIIDTFLDDKKVIDDRVCRFVQTFKLNNDEIELFKEKYKNDINVLRYISYYQNNNKDAFVKIKH